MPESGSPNIVVIMADQLVPYLLGAYDHPVVQTPNLDKLAARGVRYDAAYTPYPLCAPARVSLMTGRYASSIGCYDNAAVFPADQPTIAHYLTNHGYDTALTGKMHFVGPDQLHGFRYRLTTDIFPAGLEWVPVTDEDGRFPRGGHAREYVPPEVGVRPWTKFLTYDEETCFRATEFIRERARTTDPDPYFLLASFHNPHDPFHVTQELWDRYEGAPIDVPADATDVEVSAMDEWLNETHETDAVDLHDADNLRALRRAYYGLVTYVDQKVGEIVEALESTGQLDNTVLMFTSDHGDMLGERGMVQKRCFYEWSSRVPLLIAFPDGRFAGRRITTPVSMMDLAPTILDVAGVPASDRLPMDAESLLAELVSGPDPGSDPVSDSSTTRDVFSEYHVEKVRSACFMVRRENHKYIYIHGYGAQLFDLANDPDERHNLVGDPAAADIERQLHNAITARFDVEGIDAAAQESLRRRVVVNNAMVRNGVRWDYDPRFPQEGRYVR